MGNEVANLTREMEPFAFTSVISNIFLIAIGYACAYMIIGAYMESEEFEEEVKHG